MEVNEVVIVIIGGTLIMLILMIFIISFFFVHSRRQQAHKLEKAAMESSFNEEILTAKNEVQENTMKHIARELHDNVGQLLSLVKIQLNTIDDENPGIKRVSDSKEYLNKALTDLRGLSKTLNSDNILIAGLLKGIDFELQRIEKTGFLKTSFQNQAKSFHIPAKIEVVVFRIFQEIVQNVLKHAKAKNLQVCLHENEEGYTLEVTDDGQGFNLQEKTKGSAFESGSGLANLRSRAKLIDGELEINSGIGQGTTIRLILPKAIATSHDYSSPNR